MSARHRPYNEKQTRNVSYHCRGDALRSLVKKAPHDEVGNEYGKPGPGLGWLALVTVMSSLFLSICVGNMGSFPPKGQEPNQLSYQFIFFLQLLAETLHFGFLR